MSELFLRTLLIGLATSVGSYFIIKFLHKHLRQVERPGRSKEGDFPDFGISPHHPHGS